VDRRRERDAAGERVDEAIFEREAILRVSRNRRCDGEGQGQAGEGPDGTAHVNLQVIAREIELLHDLPPQKSPRLRRQHRARIAERTVPAR
jgi:hypothetical protein